MWFLEDQEYEDGERFVDTRALSLLEAYEDQVGQVGQVDRGTSV